MIPLYVECDTNDQGCGTKYPGDLDNCPECGAATAIVATVAQLPPDIYIYDIETFPNIFTMAILHPATYSTWLFEISDRTNDYDKLTVFLYQLVKCKGRMVGYNNVNFDYPVIHYIMTNSVPTNVEMIYDKSMSIINSDYNDNSHIIWDNNQLIQQIDLFKIHHFDNKAKRTSLKALEFFMRMKNIRDLPYPVGTHLSNEQKDVLIDYNWHDILATGMFYVRTLEMIEFRETLCKKYNKNYTNYNDVKIGSEVFQIKLEEAGIQCFDRVGRQRYPRQTIRSSLNLSECIPDYIQFENPAFRRILYTFKETTLYGDNVKSLFKELNCTIDGLTYEFGAGGQHAGRPGLYQADQYYCIVDIDVEGMYPNVGAENNIYPEHIGPGFSPIFKGLITDRIIVGKKTILGQSLKLAANGGGFGKLGDKFSFLFDLKAFLSITLTGQLVLSMLVEQILKINNATILQTNTDGLTVHMLRKDLEFLTQLVDWWENITKLKMEYNYYSRLWIKNVNSYIAEDEKTGKLKRKKDYNYDLEYHKDPSALIVPKAIEHYLVHGQCIEDFITHHKDPYDFCIRAKVPKNNKLIMRWGEFGDQELQRITRYFISKTGGSLVKIAPARGEPGQFKRANSLTDDYFNTVLNEIGPNVWDERIHTKNKSVYTNNVETGINVGWKATDCSDMDNFNWNNIDYDYYIEETEKLIV